MLNTSEKSGIDESTVFFDRNDVETLILKTKILIKYAENLIKKNKHDTQ
ncbi:unnamed protein product [marine sediment metagenome]|uniref:Uncharacterized protein n=1 Tax=marine sediment metagenome TaxID=412755 RepID=X1I2P8_9ZZZZ